VILLEVAFLAVFWAWAFTALVFLRNTFVERLPLAHTPQDAGLVAETVRFQATDGVWLEGWKIAGALGRSWIILCHGAGSNRSDVVDIAAGLRTAGFNTFLFDFRGHGGSNGRTTSFGWTEQRDLEGALAFLGQQPEVLAAPYGVYGISMGAAVAILVGARDERIGAVAADSSYTSLEDTLVRHLELLYPYLPSVPFQGFLLFTYRCRFGIWPRQIAPVSDIGRLSPRPLLLIQGADDPRMPLQGAQELLAKAAAPKELWVVQGAGHLGGFAQDPSAYLGKVTAFFHRALHSE